MFRKEKKNYDANEKVVSVQMKRDLDICITMRKDCSDIHYL